MRILLILIFTTSAFISKAQGDTTIFNGTMMVVEKMPSYYGGELQLMRDINTLAIYSDEAKDNKVEGRVYISFYIETDGTLSDISLLEGVNQSLDSIAISVFYNLNQKWRPGNQGSKPVRIQYRMPIIFNLDNTLSDDGKISGYWKYFGKYKLKRQFKKMQIFNDNEFNCWYRFITSNYNSKKLNQLNLDLMFQSFNCENVE